MANGDIEFFLGNEVPIEALRDTKRYIDDAHDNYRSRIGLRGLKGSESGGNVFEIHIENPKHDRIEEQKVPILHTNADLHSFENCSVSRYKTTAM